jgi:DNA-binding NarL/FixJ family response regulator
MLEVTMIDDERLERRVLDALDVAIIVLTADCEAELLRNAAARRLFGDQLPTTVRDGIQLYVPSRRDLNRMPPPMRLLVGERAVYLRVVASAGPPPIEIAVMSEEVLRDADAFKLLSTRYGVTRHEFQVMAAIRLGKTNKQIAAELGLAEGTINSRVQRLLRRFDVPNRTRLADLVERIIARRV